jgi:hypothetical protein
MKSSLQMQPPAAMKDDIAWRQFPTVEQVLGAEEPAPLLARIEKTCRQLNRILQAGSQGDKDRAQLAISAYGRSLDLLRTLMEIRDNSTVQR